MKVARFQKVFVVALAMLAVLLLTAVAVTGCGEETKTTTTTAANVMGDRALLALSTTPTSGEYTANVILSGDLVKKLADPNEKSQLFLLDIRKKENYDKGHIEGATQVEFSEWATDANLSKYPKDRKIIVICYTGNTAAQAVSVMRMLGYDAVALKGGMEGWAPADAQSVANSLRAANNPVVMTPSPETFLGAPTGAVFDKPDDAGYKEIAAKANTVFSAKDDPDYAGGAIAAAKLSEKLKDPAQKDKIYLLDIRKKEDYEKVGHIDGAVQMDFGAVAVPDNLSKLPKDKKIVIICYTGNTAAQAMSVLKMLGYDAGVLRYGMMGWTNTPDTEKYSEYILSAKNPVVTGP